MKQNEKIMKEMEELRAMIGDVNKNKSELPKFNSSSHIKLESLIEESMITDASPNASSDILKIK